MALLEAGWSNCLTVASSTTPLTSDGYLKLGTEAKSLSGAFNK